MRRSRLSDHTKLQKTIVQNTFVHLVWPAGSSALSARALSHKRCLNRDVKREGQNYVERNDDTGSGTAYSQSEESELSAPSNYEFRANFVSDSLYWCAFDEESLLAIDHRCALVISFFPQARPPGSEVLQFRSRQHLVQRA